MVFRRFAWLAAAVLSAVTLPVPAGASSYKVLWNPQERQTGDLEGRLLRRSDGTLLGTSFGYPGDGIVFQLTSSGGSWTAKKIFGFSGSNGSGPSGGLIQNSNGALYGTTYNGGAHGDGTVFKLSLSGGKWTETVLHSFAGGSDGANPRCDLVRVSSSGVLYGTTQYGGGAGQGEGTVFSLAYSGGAWSEHVLYRFGGGDGAQQPLSGLHRDSAGALYGTTSYGGFYNGGIVYKLVKSGSTWKETSLHSFGSYGDGYLPVGPVIEDSNGVLYGTTSSGGPNGGGGIVFKLAPDGTETVLWNFNGGSDGAYPIGGLLMDSAGVLYGTTNGGTAGGDGTVFKLSPSGGSWSETVLHDFAGSDGATPFAGVIRDSAGNLYGTTTAGGAYGFGAAFEISP